jgi:hypothetical protein
MGDCGSGGRGFGPTFSFASPSRKIGVAEESEEPTGFRRIESVDEREAMTYVRLCKGCPGCPTATHPPVYSK